MKTVIENLPENSAVKSKIVSNNKLSENTTAENEIINVKSAKQ